MTTTDIVGHTPGAVLASASGTGPSSASQIEPVPVSPVPASVPDAGEL